MLPAPTSAALLTSSTSDALLAPISDALPASISDALFSAPPPTKTGAKNKSQSIELSSPVTVTKALVLSFTVKPLLDNGTLDYGVIKPVLALMLENGTLD